MKRPLLVWLLAFLLLFLALGGIYGGIAMLVDPSGSTLQLDTVLSELPVSNFILPGVFLLVIMGLFPIAMTYGLIVQPDWRWANAMSKWSRHYWAWTGTIGIGMILLIWLTVQGVLIGFGWPIQLVTLANGILILLVAVSPGIRKYYLR